MKATVLLPLLFAFVLFSCGTRGDAVPKRYAYPRPALQTDAPRDTILLGGLRLDAYSGGEITSDSIHGWADIVYDAASGAVMHLSVTTPADLTSAIANRRQRITLNLGAATATTEEFRHGDFSCQVVSTTEPGITTPVQILAFSTVSGKLISGATVLANPGNNADSIRPLIDELRSDAIRLLESL